MFWPRIGTDAELVVVRPPCMAGGPLFSCPRLLDLRTWSGMGVARSCVCDDVHSIWLHCDGVGGVRLEKRNGSARLF